MSSTLVPRLLLLPVAALLLGASPLVDPLFLETPASLSQKEVTGIVRKTLITRDWKITQDHGNEIEARLDVRDHSIKVRYTIGADHKITMKYLDSVNMDYRVDRHDRPVIHRKYAGWMQNVSTALSREMQLAMLAKSN